MFMSIRRLAYGLGAEVLGVDPAGEVGAATLAQLVKAWEDHQVLVFRGVEWSLGQQVAFSRRFGELELHPLKYLRNPDCPEVFEVINRLVDGKPSATGEVGRMWHSDGAYTVKPPTASHLHCRQIPDSGGTTWHSVIALPSTAPEAIAKLRQAYSNALKRPRRDQKARRVGRGTRRPGALRVRRAGPVGPEKMGAGREETWIEVQLKDGPLHDRQHRLQLHQ